jgi:hypothetical protein
MSELPTLPNPAEVEAWNHAHDRLLQFLHTFGLGDHTHVSRLALEIVEEARALHRADPTHEPVETTMRHVQARIAGWMAENLREEGVVPSRLLASGYVALLISRLYRVAPATFLEPGLPVDLRNSLRSTLVVTGPDLNVSSMTPRHLDYGPMLDLARQTWHRFDARAFFLALLFWGCVYTGLYLWLSGTFE